MKNKAIVALLALVLCMGVFFVPVTAFAAGDEDTVPPKLTATLDDGTLHIEASDDNSGVEAVYIDNTRVNSLANGKADVLLKDYAGNGKQVSIYAVDYAGNRSTAVKIDNPYYQAPASLPAPTAPSSSAPASSSSTPAPSSSAPASSSSQPPASSSQPASSSSSGSESAIGTGDSVVTPEGTGTVTEVATDEDGKLFYTIVTPAGNVFYLVIDMARTDGNNVYFLNAVTEDDLAALAETDGRTTGGETAIPTPDPDPTPEPQPDNSEPEADAEPEKEGGGIGTIIFIVLAIVAVGGAGYYIKIVRPKQQQAAFDDDLEDDDEYSEDYPEGIEYSGDDYLPDDYDEQAYSQAAEDYQSSDGSGSDDE